MQLFDKTAQYREVSYMDNCYNSTIIHQLEAREDTRDFADAVKATLQKWSDPQVTLSIPHHFEVVVVGACEGRAVNSNCGHAGIIPYALMYRSRTAANIVCNQLMANGTLCKVMPRTRRSNKSPEVYLN